ncbi:MAG: nucleoside triphosphate pyrophosphohydrolase [Spirochaetes bacterium]|nr:nucleoside triphosphate pyrophosphohydrolase [Spirochaetota bacterium]
MKTAGESFERLYSIVRRLRAPDGCPWDRAQTPLTIRGNVIEEAYELVEAVNEKDPDHIREEAGDLFLLGAMIAYMYEETGAFSVSDSLETISEKLIRRHPHVFGEGDGKPVKVDTPDKVIDQWNQIKEKVEGRRPRDSILDEVSRALPPLERAYRIQKKVAKAGFDWTKAGDVWDKALEELQEAREAHASGNRDDLEAELGDLIYSMVNVARFLDVDPAVALHRTVEKFGARFRHVEKRMAGLGLPMSADTMAQMDEFWNESKRLEG